MRVLAAMSGGVDSAVAAARAADAGHEVTGVHLALSLNPQSYRSGARGCCTLEDARDARRAADVIGIPFYVWDMAERFHRDVVADFVAEYARGADAQPVPALQREDQVRGRAGPGGGARASTRCAPVTTPGWRSGRLHRSPDLAKDQSYVLAVLNREQLTGRCSRWADSTKAQVRAEAAARGLAVADKPDSHDVCFIPDGDTRAFLAGSAGQRPRAHRGHRRDRGRQPRGRLRVHHRPAQGAAGGRPGRATAGRVTCWTSSPRPARSPSGPPSPWT